ncbi:MAG: hypothetical protein PHY48_01840 [Candidatus Cloacimonetes bacterium]|nr:hypothetical protein [Candidatus Cloacimonadota bacterium]
MRKAQKALSRILAIMPYIKWYMQFVRDHKSYLHPKNLKQDLWAYLHGFYVETACLDGINE